MKLSELWSGTLLQEVAYQHMSVLVKHYQSIARCLSDELHVRLTPALLDTNDSMYNTPCNLNNQISQQF